MIKGGDNWNVAKPTHIDASGGLKKTDEFHDFADGLKWTIAACKLFLFLTIFSVISTIQNNQGASLTTNGAPNGLLGNFNSPTIIFGTTVELGDLLMVAQDVDQIFSRPSYCLQLPDLCNFTVWILCFRLFHWNVSFPNLYLGTNPTVFPTGFGGIFLNMTSYEIAYNRAPQRMKGAVFAIALFMSALSAIILIVPPSFVDPNLIWPFVGLAVAVVVSALLYSIRWTMRKPRSSLSEPHGRSRALLGHRRTEHTFHESSANP